MRHQIKLVEDNNKFCDTHLQIIIFVDHNGVNGLLKLYEESIFFSV